MTFHTTLDNGKNISFKVYDYHYQNVDLKKQFQSTFPNIVVLLQKQEDNYIHLETILLEDPNNYFTIQIPTDTLCKTSKVLLLGGTRPKERENTIKLLKKYIKPIEKHFKTPVKADQLEPKH